MLNQLQGRSWSGGKGLAGKNVLAAWGDVHHGSGTRKNNPPFALIPLFLLSATSKYFWACPLPLLAQRIWARLQSIFISIWHFRLESPF